MMILVFCFFLGLFSSTSGQTPVVSLSKAYVNKSESVTITCAVNVTIIDSVVISRNGTNIFQCPVPPVPCTNLVSVTDYGAVQNAAAGTTTMTIGTSDISRDTGNWTCQYGTTSTTTAVSLTVGSAPSITQMTEMNTTAVIVTGCTFPYAVRVYCLLGGTNIGCQSNVNYSSTCSDSNERVLTISIDLGLFTGSASGYLTVHVDNQFFDVSKMGSVFYSFTAPTTPKDTYGNNLGNHRALELGLGLGLGLGIPCVIASIVVVIFVCKGKKPEEKPPESTAEEPEEKPLEPTDQKNKTKNAGSSGAVSRENVEIRMEGKSVKDDEEERPPAIRTGNQNKVKSETTSEKTNGRTQPLPPVAVVTGDIPKPRAQPPPPENIDVKDPIQRGISANFDDKQGLPTETPRSSKLPPLEDTLKEPKKKRKKKNKKKGQINEGNPEEQMVELTSKRTLPEMPEDQSDGD